MFDNETVMDNTPTTGQGIGSLSQPIDQLELVMADVESFLTEWLRRLEQLNTLSTTPDGLLRNRVREFELEKSQFEAKRRRETQEIHDKAEELTKAWLRLEQEQRRFLQVRDSHAQGSRPPSAEYPQQDSSREIVSKEARVPTQPGNAASNVAEEAHTRRPSPLQSQPAKESAVRQFEQLRREIQSNRHQRRRV